MNQNSKVVKIGSQLVIDGFIYNKSRDKPEIGKTYWDCKLLRRKECTARAISSFTASDNAPKIYKGPQHVSHDHVADPDECEAEIIKYRLKKEGENNPERPPSRLLQEELQALSKRVLAKLPERENLKRSIRVAKRRVLPSNPTSLRDITDLPEKFKNTLTGDRFLIHDSRVGSGRIIVFSTRRNLQLLKESDTWFLDGTFKVRHCYP